MNRAVCGPAWQGVNRPGLERQCGVWRGLVWHGQEGQGMARHGPDRQGVVRSGDDWRGKARVS